MFSKHNFLLIVELINAAIEIHDKVLANALLLDALFEVVNDESIHHYIISSSLASN